jgi:hypothetical protein
LKREKIPPLPLDDGEGRVFGVLVADFFPSNAAGAVAGAFCIFLGVSSCLGVTSMGGRFAIETCGSVVVSIFEEQ